MGRGQGRGAGGVVGADLGGVEWAAWLWAAWLWAAWLWLPMRVGRHPGSPAFRRGFVGDVAKPIAVLGHLSQPSMPVSLDLPRKRGEGGMVEGGGRSPGLRWVMQPETAREGSIATSRGSVPAGRGAGSAGAVRVRQARCESGRGRGASPAGRGTDPGMVRRVRLTRCPKSRKRGPIQLCTGLRSRLWRGAGCCAGRPLEAVSGPLWDERGRVTLRKAVSTWVFASRAAPEGRKHARYL